MWHLTIVYISRTSVAFDFIGGPSTSYGHSPADGQYVGQTHVSVTITDDFHFATEYCTTAVALSISCKRICIP